MSADWFCKIGEKKVGPLNGQQLKTIVAKGQLKPEHLVRRGDAGPWVPAGRIKGLFPVAATGAADGQAKKAPPKAAKALPAAEQAPAPPVAEVPQELAMGGHHKHVEMNVDKFNIETTPVMVSRKKMKKGLQGLKQKDQKKAKVILFSVIGGGLAFVLIVLVWALSTGKLSSAKEEKKEEVAEAPVNSGAAKPEPEKKAPSKPEGPVWPLSFKTVSVENFMVGGVDVMALKPVRGPKPEGIKSEDSEVLIVPVNLQLKKGEKKNVEFKGWADEQFKKDVKLKDDKAKDAGNTYAFLGQYTRSGDAKEITDKRIQIGLVFELPTGKMPKNMYLALPAGALQAKDAPMIAYKIDSSEIANDAKPAASSSNATGDHKDDNKKDEKKDDGK